MILLRKASIIDNRGILLGRIYPGLGLFLEWCQAGLWRTAWVRLDVEPTREIKPHRP